MKTLILIFSLLLVSSLAFAGGPKYRYQDPKLNDEVDNIYHDIDSVLKGTLGPLTISSVTVTSATVNSLIVNTSTITNLTVTSITGLTLGKIRQAITATSTSNFSTNNSAFQTTNLTASITPTSSSSRVLIVASGPIANNTQNNSTYMGLSRAGSSITGANGCNSMFTVTGGNSSSPGFCVWLDSPATTSSTAYAVILRVGGGTGSFGVNSESQSIVLLEVGP